MTTQVQDLFAECEPAIEMKDTETGIVIVPAEVVETGEIIKTILSGDKMSLSASLDLYRKVEDSLIESGGLEELGALLDLVNLRVEQKLDGYKGMLDYLKGQIDYLDQREKMFKSRKGAIKSTIEWMRGRMRSALLVTGQEKVKTSEGTYYFMKPKSPVRIAAEYMTDRYAAALQRIGLRKHKVVITIPAKFGGEFELMAENLCKLYPGATWSVTEPEYDLEGIHSRWSGGDGGRRQPAWLAPAEKAFAIR